MNSAFFDHRVKTPVQMVTFLNKKRETCRFWVKRDDLIHPQISGNKWRKLKYNIKHAIDQGYTGIASFGGAFSNHIAALASAGHYAGIRTLGFIRSHEIDDSNPTLAKARSMGMSLINLSREAYRKRRDVDFISELSRSHPGYFFVPEGGSNAFAHAGLAELADEIEQQSNVDTLACAIGSGGSISGLMKALPDHHFIGVAAVNDKPLLSALKQEFGARLSLDTAALFGGYGKLNQELQHFCLDFFHQTQIPIDPLYTGKLFYALCHHQAELGLDEDSRVLAVHTGGLQGLQGLIYRRQIDPELWQPVISSLPA